MGPNYADQGYACACFVSHDSKEIYGAFGSVAFDGECLQILPHTVEHFEPQSVICDYCLLGLVNAGFLKSRNSPYIMDYSTPFRELVADTNVKLENMVLAEMRQIRRGAPYDEAVDSARFVGLSHGFVGILFLYQDSVFYFLQHHHYDPTPSKGIECVGRGSRPLPSSKICAKLVEFFSDYPFLKLVKSLQQQFATQIGRE